MSIITLVQAGLILGKCFGFLQAWSWVEVFAPSVIYLGIGFLVGLIEAYDEMSMEKRSKSQLAELISSSRRALLSGMTRTPMVAFSSFLLFATFLVPKQEMGQMKRLILWLRGRSTKRQNEKLQS